jgi:glycosyltransferase involved in cell wall biosynthesis
VETVRRFLLPALAERVEKIWWARPSPNDSARTADQGDCQIDRVDIFPPTRSLRGITWALLRRLPARSFSEVQRRGLANLSRRHLRAFCRRAEVTHVLELCVFRGFFPRLGIPTAGIVHDLDYPDRGSSDVDGVFRDWMAHAQLLFADSTQTKAELQSIGAEMATPIRVLLLPGAPRPNVEPRHSCSSRGEKVIFYPAAALPRKGHDTFIEALASLVEAGLTFQCYLAGPGTDQILNDRIAGDQRTEIVRRSCLPWRRILGERIKALGMCAWSRIEELYALSDLVVLPSRHEGFGLPLSEALIRHRPLVVTAIPPFQEQVAFYGASDQVRFVGPGDSEGLAATLAAWLRSTDTFPPFSADLCERLASWNWGAYAADLVSYLEALASKPV